MKIKLQLTFVALLFACQKDSAITTVTVEGISESVYASGVVKSGHQYDVFSTVNGTINEIFVSEGSIVKKGTPLFSISNKTSVLNARNAKLAADYANITANKEKLDELAAAIDLAESKMNNDSLLWQRQQNLWSQKIGSKIELEQRELSYKNAITNYKSAILRYRDFQKQMELNAKQAQNTLEISTSIAEEYTIKSEINGKVYKILKARGEMVNTATPVALIGDDKTFLLELQVDEHDIVKVKPGMKVFVYMDSYKGKIFEARVDKIDPAMNERSKSFNVEAELITSPAILYPFFTVEANILIQSKNKALTIPRSYLVDESFVITEDKQKQKIVTGLKDYEKVEVLTGLKEGQIILKPRE